MPRRKIETNVDFVAQLMTEAQSGPLMQAFIMNAIDAESRRVVRIAEQDPNLGLGDSFFINPAAWIACAEEIREKFRTWNKRPEPARAEPKRDHPSLLDVNLDTPKDEGGTAQDESGPGEVKETETESKKQKQKKDPT